MNTKLDLAHIINGLMTVECTLRIIFCLVAQPLKCIYLLFGWQPKWLIDGLLWINNILPRPSNSSTFTTATTTTNFTRGDFVTADVDQTQKHRNLTITNILSNYSTAQWFNTTETNNDADGADSVSIQNIEIICFFPASLVMTVNCGIMIFTLFTSIVR